MFLIYLKCCVLLVFKIIVRPHLKNPECYSWFISFFPDENFSNTKEYEEFKNGAYPIIITVKEFYSDVSGNGYSSETAVRWLPNNAFQVIRNSTNNLYENSSNIAREK